MKATSLIQNFVLKSRFMIVIAVVTGIISAFLMIILGFVNVALVISHLPTLFAHLNQFEAYDKQMIAEIISAIDAYLIATVLLIFSIGVHELFIGKVINDKVDKQVSQVLVIKSLDQLKEKISKVVIMVLIVSYFKYAISMNYTSVLDLLYLSIGILLTALAVYFSHRK